MNFKINESITKLRGGYYTPAPVAKFLSQWVLNKKPKTILEPSCGDGVFIRALNGILKYKTSFTGIELFSEEAEKAKYSATKNRLLQSQIIVSDFLDWANRKIEENTKFDAVIGNPPYIRYQYLEDKAQQLAETIFSKFDLSFTKHTNAWVSFIIASIGLLAPSGRLAMVIPSEILHVLHAESLRKFLLSECERILLIDPNELLFEQALQGTMLLLVEKKNKPYIPSKGVAILSAPDNTFLSNNPELYFQKAKYLSGDLLNGKWMKVLLSSAELNVFEKVTKYKSITRFNKLATVDVGIVTGANKFFLVNDEIVAQFKLHKYIRPMFGRSAYCPGIIYDHKIHKMNQKQGFPTNFLMFDATPIEKLPKGIRDYIKQGELLHIHTRYKCRIRSPWYKVPSLYSTAVCMLKRSHNFPRLILNKAKVFTTDTAYRICPISKDIPNLIFNFINSLTALSAELEGRHYGGGVLELVPSEIEKLFVPETRNSSISLADLDNRIKNSVRTDILFPQQDKIVLKAAGLSGSECDVLYNAWDKIRSRRQRLVSNAYEGSDFYE
ncbi:MAG: N-6 DNA methylase [Elusimicrobia bacterium]|nr:N-6 DNA methylase [Elusimicrobiota bacterium]